MIGAFAFAILQFTEAGHTLSHMYFYFHFSWLCRSENEVATFAVISSPTSGPVDQWAYQVIPITFTFFLTSWAFEKDGYLNRKDYYHY